MSLPVVRKGNEGQLTRLNDSTLEIFVKLNELGLNDACSNDLLTRVGTRDGYYSSQRAISATMAVAEHYGTNLATYAATPAGYDDFLTGMVEIFDRKPTGISSQLWFSLVNISSIDEAETVVDMVKSSIRDLHYTPGPMDSSRRFKAIIQNIIKDSVEHGVHPGSIAEYLSSQKEGEN